MIKKQKYRTLFSSQHSGIVCKFLELDRRFQECQTKVSAKELLEFFLNQENVEDLRSQARNDPHPRGCNDFVQDCQQLCIALESWIQGNIDIFTVSKFLKDIEMWLLGDTV